jgi:hypothetical protein
MKMKKVTKSNFEIGRYPSPEGVETATTDNTTCCFLERRRSFCC